MKFAPHTDAEIGEMLSAIGIDSLDALFEQRLETGLTKSRLRLRLLCDQLDVDTAGPRDSLTLLSRLDRLAKAALREREPGRHLVPPAHDFRVAGLEAELHCRRPGGLGRSTHAQVVLDATSQQGKPPTGNEQFRVRPQANRPPE